MAHGGPPVTLQTDVTPSSLNQNGQRIGVKGQRTRLKLIETTLQLLDSVGLRDLTVANVAKLSGTSTATFYVYFDGVSDVVLAALETAETVTPKMIALLQLDFLGPQGFKRSQEFIREYVSHWDRHRTMFRVRNLAAEEGDERFVEMRYRSAMPLLDILTTKIAQAPGPLHKSVKPRPLAASLLMMLERLGATGPAMAPDSPTNFENMVNATAHIFAATLGAYAL